MVDLIANVVDMLAQHRRSRVEGELERRMLSSESTRATQIQVTVRGRHVADIAAGRDRLEAVERMRMTGG